MSVSLGLLTKRQLLPVLLKRCVESLAWWRSPFCSRLSASRSMLLPKKFRAGSPTPCKVLVTWKSPASFLFIHVIINSPTLDLCCNVTSLEGHFVSTVSFLKNTFICVWVFFFWDRCHFIALAASKLTVICLPLLISLEIKGVYHHTQWYISVLPVYKYVYRMHVCCLWRPDKSTRCPGVRSGCKSQCGF